MDNQEWQELHNDNAYEDGYTGKDIVDVEIEWGTNIVYECRVEVETFRNQPASAECIEMTRYMFNPSTGEDVFTVELEYVDFPHFITKAAEKKAMGE